MLTHRKQTHKKTTTYGIGYPCCMFFFDVRILITPLVSSNSSWNRNKHVGELSRFMDSLPSSLDNWIFNDNTYKNKW